MCSYRAGNCPGGNFPGGVNGLLGFNASICTYLVYVEYNITYFFLHFRSFAGINPQRGTKSAGKGGTNAKLLSLINALHDFESDWKSCD